MCIFIFKLSFKISNWTKLVSNASNEVFALVLKNPEKLSNKQLNDLKTSIFTNYPEVKFNLLSIKTLDTFQKNLQKMIRGIDVAAVMNTHTISEYDLVAIASGPKYKSVSLIFNYSI